MIEYGCEGCGANVYAFGMAAPPSHGFCGTCAWLCEAITDPVEMMALRGKEPFAGRLGPRRYWRDDRPSRERAP